MDSRSLPANSGLGWNSLSTAELILWRPPVSAVDSWRRTLADIRSRPEAKR